jgi:hypothetical protein
MTRSGAVGSQPATAIVGTLLRAIPASVEQLVILFDYPAAVPTKRSGVHAARAKGKTGTAIDETTLAACTPGALAKHGDGNPVTWQELFSTTRGKARAYDILHEAFRTETLRTGPAHRSTTITCPRTAEVFVHPFAAPSQFAADLALHPYGEAEAQLAMCVRGMAGRDPDAQIGILTIDTDILLQVALTPSIPSASVVIAIAKVFRNESTVVRVAGDGRKRAKAENLTQAWELVACSALAEKATPAGLFWHLCAGGVDYCKGLGGYGWPQRTMIAQASAPVAMFVQEPDGWTMDIQALAGALLARRKSKRREMDVGALCNELDAIVFCWRYYMWQCDTRPDTAGPEEEPFFQSRGAKTVSGWLSVAHGRIFLPNTFQ